MAKASKTPDKIDLGDIAKQIREKYKLSEPPTLLHERVSTGIPPLDWLLGGGIPLRAFTLFYGAKSSGKTTVAGHVAGQFQKQTGLVVWVDNENSFAREYFVNLGVDPETVVYKIGTTIEETFKLMSEFSELSLNREYKKIKFLFVWDSIAATPSALEESASFDQITVGAGARALSAGFRKISQALAESPNVAYLVINQVRENMNAMWGDNREGQYGGRALEHWASLNLHFKQIRTLKDISANVTRVTITKSKVSNAPLYKSVDIVVRYGVGVDIPLTMFELAKDLKVLQSSGGWWKWQDKNYRMSELLEKVVMTEDFVKKVEETWRERNEIPHPTTES